MKNKVIIRQKVINLLKNFDASEKSRRGQAILADLIKSKKWQAAKKVGLFFPTGIEFDLTPLFDAGKTVLLPKCLPKRQMVFIAYDGVKEKLVKSSFGLLEPAEGAAEVADLLVVPGLAFNAQNYRVGFGGGYYDRYLANFKGNTVSLGYDFQRFDFEPEEFDRPVEEVFIG